MAESAVEVMIPFRIRGDMPRDRIARMFIIGTLASGWQPHRDEVAAITQRALKFADTEIIAAEEQLAADGIIGQSAAGDLEFIGLQYPLEKTSDHISNLAQAADELNIAYTKFIEETDWLALYSGIW